MKKRIMNLMLIIVMALSLTGCGGIKESDFEFTSWKYVRTGEYREYNYENESVITFKKNNEATESYERTYYNQDGTFHSHQDDGTSDYGWEIIDGETIRTYNQEKGEILYEYKYDKKSDTLTRTNDKGEEQVFNRYIKK